jgi:hypothetical protein
MDNWACCFFWLFFLLLDSHALLLHNLVEDDSWLLFKLLLDKALEDFAGHAVEFVSLSTVFAFLGLDFLNLCFFNRDGDWSWLGNRFFFS